MDQQQIRFTEDLHTLENLYNHLCKNTKECVMLAFRMVQDWDSHPLPTVFDRDKEVNRLDKEVHDQCFKILALYAPLASDLRYILAMLHSVNSIQSISERSVKIAKRTEELISSSLPQNALPFDFSQMGPKVLFMIDSAFQAISDKHANDIDILTEKGLIDEIHRNHRTLKNELFQREPSKAFLLEKGWSISNHFKNISDEIKEIVHEAVFIETGELPK